MRVATTYFWEDLERLAGPVMSSGPGAGGGARAPGARAAGAEAEERWHGGRRGGASGLRAGARGAGGALVGPPVLHLPCIAH